MKKSGRKDQAKKKPQPPPKKPKSNKTQQKVEPPPPPPPIQEPETLPTEQKQEQPEQQQQSFEIKEQKQQVITKPKKHIKVKRLNAKEAFGEGYTINSVVQKLDTSKTRMASNQVQYGFQKSTVTNLQTRREGPTSPRWTKYRFRKLESTKNGLPLPGSVEEDIYMGEKEFLNLNPSRSYGRMYQQKSSQKNSVCSTPVLKKQDQPYYPVAPSVKSATGKVSRMPCSFQNLIGDKNIKVNRVGDDDVPVQTSQQYKSASNLLSRQQLKQQKIKNLRNQRIDEKNYQSYDNFYSINSVRGLSSAARATTAFSSNKSPTLGMQTNDNRIFSANEKIRGGVGVFQTKKHTMFTQTPSQARTYATFSPQARIKSSSRQDMISASLKTKMAKNQQFNTYAKQSPGERRDNNKRLNDSTTMAKSCLLQTQQDEQQFYKQNPIIKQVISKAQLQHMVENLKKRQILNKAMDTKKQQIYQEIQSSVKNGAQINSQQRQYLTSPGSSLKASIKNTINPYQYVQYLEQTKEQRSLKRYEITNQLWNKQSKLNMKKNGRKPEEQILNRIQIQRKKQQQRQGIQIMKPLVDKFGDKYWQFSLRSEQNPEKGEIRTLSIGRQNQGLYSKFYQRGTDSMPAVVRKAKKLLVQNQKNDYDAGKQKKRLVAFESKSLLGRKNKIDEFTEVKNCKIIENTNNTRKPYDNTLAQSKYLKSKIKNGDMKRFVKGYLKNLPHIQQNIDDLYIQGQSQMNKQIETVQNELRAAEERECDLNAAQNEYLIHIFPEMLRDDL